MKEEREKKTPPPAESAAEKATQGSLNKKASWVGVISIALVLSAVGFALIRKFQHSLDQPPPPPPKKTFTTTAFDFYSAYGDSVEFLTKGKALFFQGQSLLGSNPETLPESAGASPSASPLFRAAESFALAMEQIEHAEDLLKVDTMGLAPEEQDCRNLLRDNFEKYRQAVKIFNEYAKARYQNDEAKAEKFALSDGMAKWTMAESLMAKYLIEGCQGKFFSFVRDQKPEYRRRVFERYRGFYGQDFERHQTKLAFLIGYLPAPESRPLASPRPGPQ